MRLAIEVIRSQCGEGLWGQSYENEIVGRGRGVGAHR